MTRLPNWDSGSEPWHLCGDVFSDILIVQVHSWVLTVGVVLSCRDVHIVIGIACTLPIDQYRNLNHIDRASLRKSFDIPHMKEQYELEQRTGIRVAKMEISEWSVGRPR